MATFEEFHELSITAAQLELRREPIRSVAFAFPETVRRFQPHVDNAYTPGKVRTIEKMRIILQLLDSSTQELYASAGEIFESLAPEELPDYFGAVARVFAGYPQSNWQRTAEMPKRNVPGAIAARIEGYRYIAGVRGDDVILDEPRYGTDLSRVSAALLSRLDHLVFDPENAGLGRALFDALSQPAPYKFKHVHPAEGMIPGLQPEASVK